MKKIVLLSTLLVLCFNYTFSQNGTDFWFVAPEVTESGNHDRPIYLKISTGPADADVTIAQPAQSAGIGFGTPIVRHILKNSIDTFNVSQWIDLLESGIITNNIHNDNAVEKKGLHITSTAGISCYYEVVGMDLTNPDPKWRTQIWNSEIFTLKGSAALGTRFYTPFQRTLKNGFDGWSAIHIVASMNNTHVTITPTTNLVGHGAGVPFTITLQQGETYCGRATGQAGADHPGGTLVTSDKPIAVTIKDDSVFQNSGADLVGDQIVPTNIVGTDYIVVKGYLNSGGDRAIICATQNKTVIKANGVQIAILDAGQQYDYPVSSGSVYIQSSAPAYVFQISGIGDELAGALLPPIICTGSKSVSFTRDTDEAFYMNILVQTQFVNGFTLNGIASPQIAPAAFSSVPNSPSPGWSSAQIQFSPAQLQTGKPYTVSNSLGNFHLGILNGANTNSSSRYGYFSAYNSTVGQLGGDVTICQGESHTFDLGSGFSNIVWNGVPSTDSTFTASSAGAITVSATKGGCALNSTVQLIVNTLPKITLQPIASLPICDGVNMVLTMAGIGTDSSYQWEVSTDGGLNYLPLKNGTPYYGVATKTLTITAAAALNGNKYRAVVYGACSPPARSNPVTFKIEENPVMVNSPSDVAICLGLDAYFNVSANGNNLKYQWQEKSGTNDFVDLPKSGKYLGTDSSTLRIPIPNAVMNGNQYKCIVKGACKSVVSNVAQLKVDALGCNEIIIPDVITPVTTPGFNDTFVIQGNKPGSELKLYNRWGLLLATISDYKNDWDGEHHPDGVYFYIYTFSGNNKQYKGFIEVIR